MIDAFATHLGYADGVFDTPESAPEYFSDAVATVSIGNDITGYAGEIAKAIREAFDVKTPVRYAELDITELLEKGALPVTSCTPLPRYPALERDFCFVMDERLSTGAISGTISTLSDLIEAGYPFDVYRGKTGYR